MYIPSITSRNDPEMPGRIIAQIAMAPARKNTHHAFVTTSAASSAAWVSDRSPSSRKNVRADPEHDRDRDPVDLVEHAQRHPDRPGDEAEEQRRHLDRLVVEEPLEHRRQREHGGENAGEQREQPDPLDGAQRLAEPVDVTGEQLLEPVRALADVVDQLVVDAEHEGDGAAGHAGDDVGGSHRETADDLGNRGGNSHAVRLLRYCVASDATSHAWRCQPNHSSYVGTFVTPAHAMATSGTAAMAPEPSPMRMSRSSSGRLSSRSKQLAMAGFGGAVSDRAVVECRRVDHHQRQHRRGDDVAIEHHRDRTMACRHGRRCDRDQFRAADLAQDLERVGDPGDSSNRLLHGRPLAGQPLVVDTGAASDPRGGFAARQRGSDRRRRRGVADADLAEDQEVAIEPVDGIERDADDVVESFGSQRRLVADVAGRPADPDVDRLDRAPAIRAKALIVERPCWNAPKSASVMPVG